MKIVLLAGARPNFIKAAALWKAFRQMDGMQVRLVHTGQHRDPSMSGALLKELGLPEPDAMLSGKGQTRVREIARIALALEPILQSWRPDWVVVIGDVTSTLAGAVAAKQMGIPLAHVEAGLRSHDRQMPEELNRIVVDHLADLLFPSEEAGVENLHLEGIPSERVYFAGNVLIDTLAAMLPEAGLPDLNTQCALHRPDAAPAFQPNEYALFTFHRPSNVDDPTGLRRMIDLIRRAARHLPVLFPIHPRTLHNLKEFNLIYALPGISELCMLPPLGYRHMIGLLKNARLVVTDSGGVQEETTWLGKPCLTFRTATERPATVTYGTNTVVDDLQPETAERLIRLILAVQYKSGKIPPLWDGHAAERIAVKLASFE